MQLEAGKFYKTRDGRKAYVASVDNPLGQRGLYPVIGYMSLGFLTWTADGRFLGSPENCADLVAEWVDPVTRTVEVVLLRSPTGHVAANIGSVGCGWMSEVLDRQTVTLTEGGKR